MRSGGALGTATLSRAVHLTLHLERTMDNGTPSSRLVEARSVHPGSGHAERHSSAIGRRAAIASGLLALLSSAAAWCATEPSRSVVVLWSGDDQWVRIEPQDDSAASPNDHPAELSTEEVSNALAALRLRVVDEDTGTESQRAVFTREEIANLAPQVAGGLGRAGPKQDVTFSTIGSHGVSTGGLIKDPGVNAGRVFCQDGKLNVIFGELQSNYRKKNVYGQRTEDFTPRRQGTRGKASKQKWTVATGPGIQLHSMSDGAVRNDWVVIDPAVAGAQTVATSQPTAAAPQQAASAPTPAKPVPPPPTSGAAPEPAADAAQAPAASTTPESRTGKSTADLEQRLQTLRDLRDKGLISEEAYNSKVKELLSEL